MEPFYRHILQDLYQKKVHYHVIPRDLTHQISFENSLAYEFKICILYLLALS